MGCEFEVRCLRRKEIMPRGLKPLFAVPEHAKTEALANLEASVGFWLDHEA